MEMRYTPERLAGGGAPKPVKRAAQPYCPKRLAGSPASPSSLGKAGARRRWALVGDGLYYLALALFVLGVFLLRGAGGGAPVRVLGFSAMRVLTTSMGEALPQGALIITQEVDPDKLAIGDDITYLVDEDVTVTHRIVAITEDYADSGRRAFTTQGTENSEPDSRPVPAQNVVGKVIFRSLALGNALAFVREHWPWLLALAALSAGLWGAVRVVVQENRKDRARAGREGSDTT